jgi:hypothetical protein
MARGGKRPGAGRKKGALTARSQQLAAAAAASGQTPLEFLISVMRDAGNKLETRLDAAKAAAGYVHPRLAAIEHSGNEDKPLGIQVLSGVPRLDSDGDGDGTAERGARPH